MNLLFEGNVNKFQIMSCAAQWRKSGHGKRKVSMTANIMLPNAVHYSKISRRQKKKEIIRLKFFKSLFQNQRHSGKRTSLRLSNR